MGDRFLGERGSRVVWPQSRGGARKLLWEGRNGPVGPHSFAAAFHPRGGKENGGELGPRRTSLPSTGSRGWLRV